MSETRDQLVEILLDVVPDIDPQNLTDSQNFREAFDIDSMDFLAIVEQAEAEFSVSVPESAYAQLQTLEGFEAFLAKNR